MWSIALVGFLSKVVWTHRIDAVATPIYVLLGWLPITSVMPLLERMPVGGLWWMLHGGVCYTVGTIFLTLDQRVKYFHAVWHLLVIVGSALHYVAILFYVVP